MKRKCPAGLPADDYSTRLLGCSGRPRGEVCKDLAPLSVPPDMRLSDYHPFKRCKPGLLQNCQPFGHPVHVIIDCHDRRPVFRNDGLAAPLFALVADHPQTLACCLMPDHLHWLIADAGSMRQLVHSFKSYSTYAARTLGHREKLWQRSYWDHVLRREEDLRQVAEHIVQDPVRSGLVKDASRYPYQSVKVEPGLA